MVTTGAALSATTTKTLQRAWKRLHAMEVREWEYFDDADAEEQHTRGAGRLRYLRDRGPLATPKGRLP